MEKNIENKPNNVLKVVKIVVDVLLYLVVAVMLIFSISIIASGGNTGIPNLFGSGYIAVQSNSMEARIPENAPADYVWPKKGSFDAGDLIFVTVISDEQKEKLEIGDVITFFDRTLNGLNTHRIIEVQAGYVITQGDLAASIASDSQEIVNKEYIRGVYYSPNGLQIENGKMAGFGSVLLFLQQPAGFAIVVILPVVAILVYEGIKLARLIIVNNRKKNEGKLAAEKDAAIAQLELEKEKLKEELMAQLRAEQEKNSSAEK